jgi:hypothetical protein
MYIGSGDVSSLLSGINTKGYLELWQRFMSGTKPYYNSYNSPIDALRTGKILEDRYFLTLPDDYYEQYVETCKELDVLKSSIDFARLSNGQIIDFDELKTCELNDFLLIQNAKERNDLEYIKKTYKINYNQVQFQLLCTGLKKANLVFLSVYSYNDEENYGREVKENETVKFKIQRDEKVIDFIKDRAKIFQTVKDYFKNNENGK